MNRFAAIERVEDFQFKKVKYYSILFEGREVNEFFDFLNRMEDETDFGDDLDKLMVWLEIIGEGRGAQKRYFRNEAIISDVSALPPPKSIMKQFDIEVNDLRLYCCVINESVVILFNGGIKTTQNAKDCPNVGRYIKQANQLTQKIQELFTEREIMLNDSGTDIIFDQDLTIEL